MKYNIFLFAALLLACLTGCETLNNDEETVSYPNAVIIKPANPSLVDAGLLTKDGTVIYPIGSAFGDGGFYVPDYISSRCMFFGEKYTEWPLRLDVAAALDVAPAFAIHAVEYFGVEYTKPGQQINEIVLAGIDNSLGLGYSLSIPMKQGKYEGKNSLIKDVRIDSYQRATITDDNTYIHIVITSNAGDVIILHFTGKILPTGDVG